MELLQSGDVIERVLSGNIRAEEIPEIPQRVVRVFLNSTGADSITERNVFVEKVYPKLREYCSQKYGVEFQMVDLEWGSSPQHKSDDISFGEFRFKELQRCHELSAGPSFVAFIGQKYGASPLPTLIPAQEFELLRISLKGHKGRDTRAAPLLDIWYSRDDNSIPPVYVLKNAKSIIPEISDANRKVRLAAQEQWQEVEQEVRRLLQKGAELCYLEGLIDGDTRQKYHMSEQDMCVQHGTEESGAPKSRCILITRTIVDLKNYVKEPKANDFTEIGLNEKTDILEMNELAADRLGQLKARTKAIISDKNSLNYDVLWRYEDVIHPELHASYLNKLSTEVHDVLKRLIDIALPQKKFDIEPEIFEEVLQHWLRCKRKVVDFCGHDTILATIRSYLKGDIEKVFVLHGPSGSGKASILSKLASEVNELIPGKTICAIRYVGFTPKSSDVKQIIMSLCIQLLRALGRDASDIPYDFKDLQRYFNDILQSVPSNTTLVLFLDALEKLNPEYNAYFMSWLPTDLRSNVKIVVSVHSTTHQILDKLRNEVIRDTNCFLEMTPMSVQDAEVLLMYVLGLYGRQVSDSQLEVFRSVFSRCSYPMYVQLLAEQAKRIESSVTLDATAIPSSIKDAINVFFDSLEKKHGLEIVSHALGYLVASVTGLSDCEMEDILSLDDDVLNSVYVDFHPPVRRIPFNKWLLLKDDIQQFLNYREADGITVSMWFHDEFDSAVKGRYLQDETTVKDMHSMLADYFLGTWAGVKKPVKLAQNNNGPLKPPCGSDADRLVASQPLSFESEGGLVRFNRRKYDQVPRHLYLAGRFLELNSLVLFNYEWLYNKIRALSLTHIMADFVLNPGEEATLVEEALRVAETTIENDINNLAPEITGHLLPYYKTHPNIRSLVQQCDTAGLKHCALIPNFPYLQVPGSSLQYTLTSPVVGEFFRFTNDDRYLLTKVKDSSLVYMFDVATGETKGSIFASNGDLYVTPNGNLFIIVDHFTEKAIKVHRSDSGAYIGQLIVMNHIQLKPKEKYKMGAVSLTNERLSVIVSTETSFLCIADIIGCQFLQIIGLDGKCSVCEVTPNGRYVFANSNEFLLCYDMYSLDHICTVSVGNIPSALAFTKDGFRAFLANEKETKLLVMHVHRGAVEMAYKAVLDEDMPDDKIISLRVSPKDDVVLVRGKNNILVYNRFTEKVCAKFPRPSDVPKEFKLPKSHYIDLFYTNAEFSRDGNFVIGTMFRNIYLWQVSTGNLITTINAPVGVITTLLVSKQRSQVITHVEGAREIQVWNINEAVNQVNMLDKLTGVIEDVILTGDNRIAYVRCRDSDEIGVVDMHRGTMLDLLTHDAPVKDYATTPNGQYVLVSTSSRKKDAVVKVWDMEERKIIKEMGNVTGFCVHVPDENILLFVSQEDASFKAPYYITQFNFTLDALKESTHPLALKYVLEKPFASRSGKFLIVLTAQDYIESAAQYDTPTICAFSLDNEQKVSYFTPESFQEAANIRSILQLRPLNDNGNTIAVIYSTDAMVFTMDATAADGCQDQYGFLVLDVNTGAINAICEPFLHPTSELDSLVFYGSSFCLDQNYNIFSFSSGRIVGHLNGEASKPTLIALNGTTIVSYKGTRLSLIRIPDGVEIANCEVHSTVCHVSLCSDERTLIAGCVDGTIVSYVIIDPDEDDAESIAGQLGSRGMEDTGNGRHSRTWDKVEFTSCPNYSRPPSAISNGPKDKLLLKKVAPANKVRPNSDTLLYLNSRSKSCTVQ